MILAYLFFMKGPLINLLWFCCFFIIFDDCLFTVFVSVITLFKLKDSYMHICSRNICPHVCVFL